MIILSICNQKTGLLMYDESKIVTAGDIQDYFNKFREEGTIGLDYFSDLLFIERSMLQNLLQSQRDKVVSESVTRAYNVRKHIENLENALIRQHDSTKKLISENCGDYKHTLIADISISYENLTVELADNRGWLVMPGLGKCYESFEKVCGFNSEMLTALFNKCDIDELSSLYERNDAKGIRTIATSEIPKVTDPNLDIELFLSKSSFEPEFYNFPIDRQLAYVSLLIQRKVPDNVLHDWLGWHLKDYESIKF